MDNATLRKLQLTQLEILREIKRVCEKYGIRYYIADGTMLGAVRHQGFIPWDDDLDVAMPRKEYEKFLKAAEKELKEQYFLQTWDTDIHFGNPFAKILKKNTRCLEAAMKDCNAHNGVWVDIFPVDSCGNREQVQKDMKEYLLWNKVLQLKCGYKMWNSARAKNSKWKYVPFIVLGRLLSRKFLIRKIREVSDRWNEKYEDSPYCVENFGSNLAPWIFRKECITDVKPIEFEGEMFEGPEASDAYLKDLYGDYMKLPPVEERGNYHTLLELKL